jgi:hypothetical protein
MMRTGVARSIFIKGLPTALVPVASRPVKFVDNSDARPVRGPQGGHVTLDGTQQGTQTSHYARAVRVLPMAPRVRTRTPRHSLPLRRIAVTAVYAAVVCPTRADVSASRCAASGT